MITAGYGPTGPIGSTGSTGHVAGGGRAWPAWRWLVCLGVVLLLLLALMLPPPALAGLPRRRWLSRSGEAEPAGLEASPLERRWHASCERGAVCSRPIASAAISTAATSSAAARPSSWRPWSAMVSAYPEAIAAVAADGIGRMSGYGERLGEGGAEAVAAWVWQQALAGWPRG